MLPIITIYRNFLSDFTKGEVVVVMSLDLSKAFDVIPHSLRLAKLKAYGFGEEICASSRDYLNDRSQRVKIGDAFFT